MNEERAREINTSPDVSAFSHEECAEADRWIKDFALRQLDFYLRSNHVPYTTSQYLKKMALYTYGSVETDQFLWKIGAYPHWLLGEV
jgi:hypothetical protein